jgi:2-keto-myo-inositol isomerase
MAAPRASIREFFDLARALGLNAVEIRNDLPGQAILDGTPPALVKAQAEAASVSLVTINALQRFNAWTNERATEARHLADYAVACGAKALVLVPVNDGSGRADGERQSNLRRALEALSKILSERGLTGLVEPLGFEICSLRLKSEAVAGINAIDGSGTFKLVHDTFHHHLAGEKQLFPERAGLVHISGVRDPSVAVADMRDPHRVLVDEADRLGNVRQIEALVKGGYDGLLSFESFSEEVHGLKYPSAAIAESIAFIRNRRGPSPRTTAPSWGSPRRTRQQSL